jgi:hypothetical protein
MIEEENRKDTAGFIGERGVFLEHSMDMTKTNSKFLAQLCPTPRIKLRPQRGAWSVLSYRPSERIARMVKRFGCA